MDSIKSPDRILALIKKVYASSLSEDLPPVGTSESKAFKPNVLISNMEASGILPCLTSFQCQLDTHVTKPAEADRLSAIVIQLAEKLREPVSENF